jgi:hypothetical protein
MGDFKIKSSLERPSSLNDGDTLFRYHLAVNYCRNKTVLHIGTGYGFGAII